MTVEIGLESERAVHLESGLMVEWVRDEPAQDRKSHFKLVLEGLQIPFEACYDFGDQDIVEKDPEISPEDLSRKLLENPVKNYHAQNIAADFDRETFVKAWQSLVSAKASSFKISVFYSEWTKNDMSDIRKWSGEG
ncbi:hypothetical protein [Roseibium marinum]|uniref:Uncharacterized protein n=1 Tax=Roseibium marinum TaxID=281252 RepID=A0A2S3V2L8_9HYPH|nr:hypothetical protein [Roseibium marinum]POF34227.1 hypothetical protein CLV41_101679 [Roseibium marinum]